MRFLRQTLFHIVRIIKTPQLLIMLFIIPFLTSGLMLFIGQQSGGEEPTATADTALVVGAGNESVLAALPEAWAKAALPLETLDAELLRLDRSEVNVVYELPEAYVQKLLAGESPEIRIYSATAQGRNGQLEALLAGTLRAEALDEYLAVHELTLGSTVQEVPAPVLTREGGEPDSGFMMTSIMIMVFVMMNGPMLGSDLVSFRKEQSLKRIVGTPNSSYTILGSFLAAYFVFFALANLLIMLILRQVGGYSMNQFGIVLIYLFALICFALALGLLIFRLFREPTYATLAGYGFSLLLMALSFLPMLFPQAEAARVVAAISPLHWTIEGLDANSILPGVPVILALALVAFTAGSFRLEDYVSV